MFIFHCLQVPYYANSVHYKILFYFLACLSLHETKISYNASTVNFTV
jgi:hypothetical protein